MSLPSPNTPGDVLKIKMYYFLRQILSIFSVEDFGCKEKFIQVRKLFTVVKSLMARVMCPAQKKMPPNSNTASYLSVT